MKLRSLFTVMCSTLFIMSCAHKEMKMDEGQKQTKKEAIAKAIVKADDGDGYTCIVAGDKRTVTLDKKEAKCKVSYTKFGKKEQMAWGQSNPKICTDVFTNIRTNIEKRGFKCTTSIEAKKEDRKTASVK